MSELHIGIQFLENFVIEPSLYFDDPREIIDDIIQHKTILHFSSSIGESLFTASVCEILPAKNNSQSFILELNNQIELYKSIKNAKFTITCNDKEQQNYFSFEELFASVQELQK